MRRGQSELKNQIALEAEFKLKVSGQDYESRIIFLIFIWHINGFFNK
jgi:hypothetical protein